MKAKKLIEELKKFPPGTEVCIVDWRKNIHHAGDEPQGHGIEHDFKIDLETKNVTKPFISLSFANDDYEPDGSPNYGASILNTE